MFKHHASTGASFPVSTARSGPTRDSSRPFSHHAILLPDIVCCIIDQLAQDTSALRECSLVSRIWQSPAQRHLLCCVLIKLFDPERSLPSFTSFLDSRPDLSYFVRDVYVLHGPLDVYALHVALAKLPRLRTLSIGSASVTVQSIQDIQPGSSPHSSPPPGIPLGILHLSGTDIPRIGGSFRNSLMGLLGIFPVVELLRLDLPLVLASDGTSPAGPAMLTSSERPLPRVLRLEMGCLPSAEFARELAHCISCTDLASVHFIWRNTSSPAIQQACIDIAPYMDQFEISISPLTYARARALPSLSLSTCQTLTSVFLTFAVCDHEYIPVIEASNWRHVTSMLASLPPSPLNILKLSLVAPASRQQQSLHLDECWDPFVHVLRRFADLATVSIVVMPSPLPGFVHEDLYYDGNGACHDDVVAFLGKALGISFQRLVITLLTLWCPKHCPEYPYDPMYSSGFRAVMQLRSCIYLADRRS